MTDDSSRENRRHRRYDVMDVRGSLVHHLDARVLNMSLTGMAIETSAKLAIGGSYWLKIPHENETIRFKADVKWCKLVRTEVDESRDIVAVYQAGIDFRTILDERAQQVLEFIQGNIVVELNRRIFGRFEIAEGSGVGLEGGYELSVRQISRSGMMVETDFSPAVDDVLTMTIDAPAGPIEVRARVANTIPLDWDNPAKGAKVGLELLDLTAENRRRIEAFIESVIE